MIDRLQVSKKLLIAVLALLFALPTFSQVLTTMENAKGAAKDHFDRGYYDFGVGRMEEADSLMRLATDEKDNFIDAWSLIGQINLEYLQNYERAVKAFEKVKELKADYLVDINFQIAKSYIYMGEYAKAKAFATEFLQQPKINAGQNMEAMKMLKDCDFAVKAMKNPVDFKPINLGDGVNTTDEESMPTLTADGKYLYFTRHTGIGRWQDENIYVSIYTGAGFSKANSVGVNVNTERYVEGAQSISPSGKYLFFTSGERPDGAGRADIYMSRKVGEVWEAPYNIGNPVNTPGWESQPCISGDGRTLFFAGVRMGGEGASDIWMSNLRDDGTWSMPQNLGETINTAFDEMRPFIHPDGNTLYFSSKGHPGMGDFDVYVSRKEKDGTWGAPVNLGYPINTPGVELGIFVTTDGTTAYYASEQKDTKGQMDIYSFEMPAAVRPNYTTYVKGIVYDAETREPIQANIQIYDLETGKLFATLSSDKVNSNFLSTLPTGKNYGVEVMKDGYLFYSHNIALVDVKQGVPFEINVGLSKIKVGQKVVLNNIFFESERFELKPESKAELEVVVKLLEKNATLKIEVGGHTDNTGTEENNRILSEKRAKSVLDYLVSKGIDATRVTYKGYASSKPVASNDTPEGKARNRRTEFIVTGI